MCVCVFMNQGHTIKTIVYSEVDVLKWRGLPPRVELVSFIIQYFFIFFSLCEGDVQAMDRFTMKRLDFCSRWCST